MKKASLVLADGSVYEGYSFGAEGSACGEVVFNTSMTGYQEILTDPSYSGQMVSLTYPLVGNYGINDENFESSRIQVKGFLIRENCPDPSHWQSKHTLHQYLADNDVTGICGIDTRALTRRLRSSGVMMGVITAEKSREEALDQLNQMPSYDSNDFVREVSTQKLYEWNHAPGDISDISCHIVVIDCGLKYNILRLLRGAGCKVTVVPCTYSADAILRLKPDGILVSPGPGDPSLLDYLVQTVKELVGKKPLMGICLGQQLIARAFGAHTFKLKFGHRGGNHPVRELTTGKVHITAQNHGYAVDAATLSNGLEVSHINLNDGTVEGLCHREFPIFSIQYHSEASPGPLDNVHLFNKFLDMVRKSGISKESSSL